MADRVSPLMPSILDRLLGQEAPTNDEIERNRTQLVRNLKICACCGIWRIC